MHPGGLRVPLWNDLRVRRRAIGTVTERCVRCPLWVDVMSVHGRPRFAKLSVDDDLKVSIAPVHPDFRCGMPLSLMGFAGRLLYRNFALKVLRTLWALPTTV